MILALLSAAAMTCAVERVSDGDTIRACGERVRLLGIDAPEMPGHCRRGRVCAPGDPVASRNALVRAAGQRITVTTIKHDRYGRIVAVVTAGGRNLSCEQIRAGRAVYKAQWDDGGRVRRACPEVAR